MGARHSAPPCVTETKNQSQHDPAPVPHRSSRPQHEFLLEHETVLLRQNWEKLSAGDTQSMGIRIFLRIFDLVPATKDAFESFRDLSQEDLLTNVLFRSHSMRFMRAVEGTIVNLDALDVIIVPNLKQLGRKHTQFHGFHPEYLVAFEQAMDEVWRQELGEDYTGSQSAWKKIFHMITTNVLEGYTEASSTPKKAAIVHDSAPAAAADIVGPTQEK